MLSHLYLIWLYLLGITLYLSYTVNTLQIITENKNISGDVARYNVMLWNISFPGCTAVIWLEMALFSKKALRNIKKHS